MKKLSPRFFIALGLVLVSVVLYSSSTLIFHDPKTTLFYMLQDLAFLPLYVFIVTIILEELMAGREKERVLKKQNMVIGVFFSELGSALLREILTLDAQSGEIGRSLQVKADWKKKDFEQALSVCQAYQPRLQINPDGLSRIKTLLAAQKPMLLSLLENPTLLEHESFTETLWAVFHCAEELHYRATLDPLSAADTEHLALDLKRVYLQLLLEWVRYMSHLKEDYPYLYSLSLRLSPFNPTPRAEIA